MENPGASLPPNVIDLLLDTVFLVDLNGRIVHVSAACERMFGYMAEEMIGQPMIDFVVFEDRARTIEESRHVIAGCPRIGFENRYRRKDGHSVHIMWSARWSETDRLRIGVARDVTDQKHANAMQAIAYAVSEATHNGTRLPILLENIQQIIAVLVPIATFVVAIHDTAHSHVGIVYQWHAAGVARKVPETLMRDYPAVPAQGSQPLQQSAPVRDDPVDSETHHSCVDDLWLAIPLTTQQEVIGALFMMPHAEKPCSERDRALLQFVSTQVALAFERKRLKDDLIHSARYDGLTGAANRRLFHHHMKSVLARCRRKQRRMALIFLDLDAFKQVNDSFGHAVGDVLLQEVARRLKTCVREDDMVARLGGDEFVVLLEEIETREDAGGIADKIRCAVNQRLPIDDLVLHPCTSLGIAVYPEDGADAEQLLKHADRAMYQDKQVNSRVLK